MQQFDKIKFPAKKVIFLFYYFLFKPYQMKKHLLLIAFSFVFFNAESATIPSTSFIKSSFNNVVNPLQYFSTLSIKEVQKLAGRKLTLKEKIAVKIFQWEIKKGYRPVKKNENKEKGETAMIFGIAGLASMLIPIPYIGGLAAIVCTVLALVLGYQAKKENPKDRKAKTAIILGWIAVGLFALAIVTVLVILSSWGGWGWG